MYFHGEKTPKAAGPQSIPGEHRIGHPVGVMDQMLADEPVERFKLGAGTRPGPGRQAGLPARLLSQGQVDLRAETGLDLLQAARM